jgi:hypothetical protein
MFPILSSISFRKGLQSPSDIHEIFLNALPQGGLLLEGLRPQEVHFQVQDFLQVIPEFKELQPNGQTNLHQDVHIAHRGLLPSGAGAEEGQFLDPVTLLEELPMFGEDSPDFVQCFHSLCLSIDGPCNSCNICFSLGFVLGSST